MKKRNKVRLAIIADRPDEAYRVLAGGGAEIERYGSQLLITVTERMSQADIFKLLQPFTLHQVKEVTASLEEIFLQLTGRGESL